MQRVAPSSLPVLLLGESGTGKEMFARAVHEASSRASGPFVVVDCSGLTESLFESELFGYEKGAFTGAITRKPGLVETADGGTLFLDEMGDVPLSMQVKLLRLIESGTYRRVGSVETRQADFRLVAATHKPLEQMVSGGLFRQDLYFRIAAFPIHLPALRERLDDLPLLAESILQRGGGPTDQLHLSAEALARMRAYHWPGNIRELRNVLDRARLYADDGVIRAKTCARPRSTGHGTGCRAPHGGPAGRRRRGAAQADSPVPGDAARTRARPWHERAHAVPPSQGPGHRLSHPPSTPARCCQIPAIRCHRWQGDACLTVETVTRRYPLRVASHCFNCFFVHARGWHGTCSCVVMNASNPDPPRQLVLDPRPHGLAASPLNLTLNGF